MTNHWTHDEIEAVAEHAENAQSRRSVLCGCCHKLIGVLSQDTGYSLAWSGYFRMQERILRGEKIDGGID